METPDNNLSDKESTTAPTRSRPGCLRVLGILAVVVLVTALLTAWWVKRNIYASEFRLTHLSEEERQALELKLSRLDESDSPEERLQPEMYYEDDAQREISISEKELNGLIAKNPETARNVAIDLAGDLVSVLVLVPFEEDFPILGGKTIRLNVGITLACQNENLVVAMRGINLGGVPLPSAWWGDIKNKNLVKEFGGSGGFWDRFSRGVESIHVQEGRLLIRLKK